MLLAEEDGQRRADHWSQPRALTLMLRAIEVVLDGERGRGRCWELVMGGKRACHGGSFAQLSINNKRHNLGVYERREIECGVD